MVEPNHSKNMFVTLDHFPNFRGEHEKYLSCHHLVFGWNLATKVAGIWNRALASFASWIQPCRMRKRHGRGVLFCCGWGRHTETLDIFLGIFLGRKRSWKTPKVFFWGGCIHYQKKHLDGYLDEWGCFYYLDSFSAPMFWNVWRWRRWPHICRLFPKIEAEEPQKTTEMLTNMCRMQSSTSTGFLQWKFLVNFHTLPQGHNLNKNTCIESHKSSNSETPLFKTHARLREGQQQHCRPPGHDFHQFHPFHRVSKSHPEVINLDFSFSTGGSGVCGIVGWSWIELAGLNLQSSLVIRLHCMKYVLKWLMSFWSESGPSGIHGWCRWWLVLEIPSEHVAGLHGIPGKVPQNGAGFSSSGIFVYFVWGFRFFAKKLCQLVDGNAPMLLVCCWILKKNLYYSLLESNVWGGGKSWLWNEIRYPQILSKVLGLQVKLQQIGVGFQPPTEKKLPKKHNPKETILYQLTRPNI